MAALAGLMAWALLRPQVPLESTVGGERQTPSFQEIRGTLRPEINESSGIAVSRRYDGLLWTHNDSGSERLLFAVSPFGETLATYLLPDTELRDWEDIALGPCPPAAPPALPTGAPERDCIYIADTGDNTHSRDTLQIYVLAEPDYESTHPTEPVDTLHGVTRFDFTYPDARYDTEALAVSPAADAYLVTKGRTDKPKIFRVPLDDPRKVSIAEYIQDLDVTPMRNLGRLVTGAAFSPNGKVMAVRTYSEVYFLRRAGDGSFQNAAPPCFFGLAQLAGEAVDFLDDSTLVMTSESLPGQPGTVMVMRCGERWR
jgi:hypothetical protein